jgi:lysophospholipase L1-like esterase
MKLLFSILFAVSTFTACSKKNAVPAPALTNMTTDTTKTSSDTLQSYLALGDSYTIGEAVEPAESYPYILVQGLNQQHYNFSYPPTVIATTGWTTDNLINAIAKSGLTGKKHDLVTLLIGVNDQFQNLSQDNYRIKFQQVLNTAISFAGGNKDHVFVLSIPDYGVTPFANGDDAIIGPLIDQFNAINQSITENSGVNYLDITAISRQAATDPTLIALDGLHPSGKMYSLWIDQLLPLVKAKVAKP